ncbi:heavy metal-associated isoprenylated plant protein 32-like [Nicotiana sylvestris]
MEPFADVSCTLKVNVNCDSCKMKMMEVLHSVRGVYALTIDAEQGIANVYGEVDPNRLLMALSRSGQHAELISVKLRHPNLTQRSHYGQNNGYGHNHNNGYGYNNNNYSAIDGPYGHHNSNGLGEPSSYYSSRRALVDRPYYGSSYRNSSPYSSYDPSSSSSSLYQPIIIDHVIREEPMNWCSIL